MAGSRWVHDDISRRHVDLLVVDLHAADARHDDVDLLLVGSVCVESDRGPHGHHGEIEEVGRFGEQLVGYPKRLDLTSAPVCLDRAKPVTVESEPVDRHDGTVAGLDHASTVYRGLVAQLRWGIMGTGDIARSMVACLRDRGSPITAVGSSRPGAVAAFAEAYGIPHALGSHEAVAAHPDVDVVYVATTNDRHLENVLACVEHRTPALCEKPIALNGAETQQMFSAAEAAGVFVMEAMWMRFQPFVAEVDRLIDDGAIGPVRTITATLGFPAPVDDARRWLNRDLGGGTILDLGVYPMTLIHHLVGSPESFQAEAIIGPTGVDVETSVTSRHRADAAASWVSTFRSDTANEAIVSGPEGRLRITSPFHHSPLLVLERAGDVVEQFEVGTTTHGFEPEVAETERCIGEGLVESPLRPHGDTVAVMDWMDAIRARIGVTYPPDET